MIKEAYCSKEVSILLKEKGFNEKCRGGYHCEFDDNDNPIVMLEEWTTQPYNNDFADEGFLCSAPTIQMALAWLRENGIIIEILHVTSKPVNDGWFYSYQKNNDSETNLIEYPAYEQAVEAALEYVLTNLI